MLIRIHDLCIPNKYSKVLFYKKNLHRKCDYNLSVSISEYISQLSSRYANYVDLKWKQLNSYALKVLLQIKIGQMANADQYAYLIFKLHNRFGSKNTKWGFTAKVQPNNLVLSAGGKNLVLRIYNFHQLSAGQSSKFDSFTRSKSNCRKWNFFQ